MITIRDRVIGFFLRSPDEELTRADMAERWACNRDAAWDALNRMCANGLLTTERRGRSFVYRPTAALLSLGDAVR